MTAENEAHIPERAPACGHDAPTISFDEAPLFGVTADSGHITLTAQRTAILGEETVRSPVIVAHLRMTPEGLMSLKKAVDRVATMIAANSGDHAR